MEKEFRISPNVASKLQNRHRVTNTEVLECFMNRHGPVFRDTRREHDTDPPTMWFVAQTDRCRVLKIVYMEYPDHFAIKTAFEPTDGSDGLYERLCRKHVSGNP